MGTFHVSCEVLSYQDRAKSVRIPRILVDTGGEYTWVSALLLRRICIAPEKEDLAFVMANGQAITRRVGFAIIRSRGGVDHG